MNGLNAAVITACAAALIGSLVSSFVTDGGTKRILSLVLGAFMVCAMILPVTKAVTELRIDHDNAPSYDDLSATADEAYQKQVVETTRQNLERTLDAILRQNGFSPDRVEVILADVGDGSIILSQVSIYLNEADWQNAAAVTTLTQQSFQITPQIFRSSHE